MQDPAAERSLAHDIVDGVIAADGFQAVFKHPVSFDSRQGEFVQRHLTDSEVELELLALLQRRPGVFLERYGRIMARKDIELLAQHGHEDAEVQHWVAQLLTVGLSEATRRRRRRQKLQQLISDDSEDSYFSVHMIRQRHPQLFYEELGRFGISHASPSAPMTPGHGAPKFSEFLVNRLEVMLEEETATQQTEARVEFTELEKADARAVFLHKAQQRFLDGLDNGVDYEAIDNDPALDDHKQLGQDAEDAYFESDVES